jgi:membrane protease YdiL (CAAX protease family)
MGLTPQRSAVVAPAATGILDPRTGRPVGADDGFFVGLNALVFAVAHLVYHSWVSVVLALAGRVIMARIYRRYGSFWGVWTIHLLFGVAVFLVGLGRYFYRAAG